MKPAPVKPDVTFDDLQKLDIRVGTIESVDDVEGSKKLYSSFRGTILAGIKQAPSEIKKQALFIPPWQEESQGMLFDLGYEDHQCWRFRSPTKRILAGIKQERENPSEIKGKQALFVVNIPPRRMAGEESQGMLFDLGYEDGVTPVLAVPESIVPNGTRAG
jgi:tRNA-binding protein